MALMTATMDRTSAAIDRLALRAHQRAAVRVIVPRRADDGWRDRLWEFCRAYWERQLPTLEAEHGWQFEIVEGHDEGTAPFNRSAAINRAAADDAGERPWDLALILDGDVVLTPAQVAAALTTATRTGHKTTPFNRRRLLTREGTLEVLEGYQGNWRRFVAGDETWNLSTCVAVTRSLWDQVGGFDERFEGWGGEDNAFHDACKALAGVEQLRGDAWHLWHEHSPWRDHLCPEYVQAKALSDRYGRVAQSRAKMLELLAEPRTADQVAVVLVTNYRRRDLVARTIASAEAQLQGPIGRRLIALDSRDQRDARDLARAHPGWDVEYHRPRTSSGPGYCRAMARAREMAIGSGQPWVFWLEDDFELPHPVDLAAMAELMDMVPQVAQLSLLRQAWYPHEVEAGGVIEANPSAFHQRPGWVEHRDYWTMNPHLVRRSFLASTKWPAGPQCERKFGLSVFGKGSEWVAGIVGAIGDEPRAIHIGDKRAGQGY